MSSAGAAIVVAAVVVVGEVVAGATVVAGAEVVAGAAVGGGGGGGRRNCRRHFGIITTGRRYQSKGEQDGQQRNGTSPLQHDSLPSIRNNLQADADGFSYQRAWLEP